MNMNMILLTLVLRSSIRLSSPAFSYQHSIPTRTTTLLDQPTSTATPRTALCQPLEVEMIEFHESKLLESANIQQLEVELNC